MNPAEGLMTFLALQWSKISTTIGVVDIALTLAFSVLVLTFLTGFDNLKGK